MMIFDVTGWCYSLIVCSGLLCLILFFMPDERNKSMIETGGACMLFILFLSPFSEMDFDTFFSEIITYSEQITVERDSMLEGNRELSKKIIESKYGEYIINEAKQNGIGIQSVFVYVCEDQGGNWIPNKIVYVSSGSIPDSFKEYIWVQLGVPKERQFTQ